MVFSSLTFLMAFLPVTLLAYALAPARLRNGVLLAASLGFYSWGAPRFVGIVLLSAAADYLLAQRIGTAPADSSARRRWLALALSLNLLLLGYFKYANFVVDQVNGVRVLLGLSPSPWVAVALPLGISFLTFQKISYLVDVHRQMVLPARRLTDYLLYVLFFPQLIAGPIVRYREVASQLVSRHHRLEDVYAGLLRFVVGLAKKVLVADLLAAPVAEAFGATATPLGPLDAWVAVTALALQFYFDFSGYSDMAIGLARMVGIRLLENFDRPMLALGLTEFWRRWHMSLGRFMRDYVFLPLCRLPGGRERMYLNLWAVFLLTGLWHGASWNFIAFGAVHGLVLTLEQVRRKAGWSRPPAWAALVSTWVTFAISLVFFRTETLGAAWDFLGALAGTGVAEGPPGWEEPLGMRYGRVLLLALTLVSAPAIAPRLASWFEVRPDAATYRPRAILQGTAALLLLAASLAVLSANAFRPFLYFQF